MENLKLSKDKYLAQHHLAGRGQNQNLSPSLFDVEMCAFHHGTAASMRNIIENFRMERNLGDDLVT